MAADLAEILIMDERAACSRLLDFNGGLRCLPIFTKRMIAKDLAKAPPEFATKSLERLDYVRRVIEPFAHHPSVTRIAATYLDSGELPTNFQVISRRVAARGSRIMDSAIEFAQCCSEMELLETSSAVASSFLVEDAEQFTRDTWLAWALGAQSEKDFVSALYFLASFWAGSPPKRSPDDEVSGHEADAAGLTGISLFRMAGVDAGLVALEDWLGCSLRNEKTAVELRSALQRSKLKQLDRLDTAVQCLLTGATVLRAHPDRGAWRALRLLEAWFDSPLTTFSDVRELGPAPAAVLQDLRSDGIARRYRTIVLDLLKEVRGARLSHAVQQSMFRERFPVRLSGEPTSGEFLPVLLELRVAADPSGSTVAEAETYLHEYLHFVQTVGTLYNHDRLLDVLNFAAAAVRELGGDDSRMISGLSQVTANFFEHLQFHRNSLDGNYESRAVPENYGDSSVGVVVFNEARLCYEYVRWNESERTFFATPLGAHAFQECLVYLNGQHARLEAGATVVVPHEVGVRSGSSLHAYTAPLHLFFRKFEARADDSYRAAATLAAVLDMSLHFSTAADDPLRFHPSVRFVQILTVLDDVEFVDRRKRRDYERFVGEACEMLGWPPMVEEIRARADAYRRIQQRYLAEYEEVLRNDPDQIEGEIAARLRGFREGCRRAGCPTEQTERDASEFESALRGSPATLLQVFGLGILEYCERALRIRLEDPWLLILPGEQLPTLHKLLPTPVWFRGEQIQGEISANSSALLQDITDLRHLYALAMQWELNERQGRSDGEYQCGMQFLGKPCPDPHCRASGCPPWRRNDRRPTVLHSFTYLLDRYGLFTE